MSHAMRPALALGASAAILALGLSACSGLPFGGRTPSDRSSETSSSRSSESPSPEATGSDTSAFAMYVGQCINTPDGAAATVEEFDCNQPHNGEVFYIHKLTDATRPSEDDMEKKATDACLAAFSPYVGKDYEDSNLSIVWMYPTVQTWATGDREIVCIATTDDDSTLNQSIKGSGM